MKKDSQESINQEHPDFIKEYLNFFENGDFEPEKEDAPA
jgi:hypothetical protein